jgi:hypothetical protein
MSKKSGKIKNKQYSLENDQKPTDYHQNWLSKIQPILSRYGLDFLGISMFAMAVLTLFGLIGWTAGSLIINWVNLITNGLVGEVIALLLFLQPLDFGVFEEEFLEIFGFHYHGF